MATVYVLITIQYLEMMSDTQTRAKVYSNKETACKVGAEWLKEIIATDEFIEYNIESGDTWQEARTDDGESFSEWFVAEQEVIE